MLKTSKVIHLKENGKAAQVSAIDVVERNKGDVVRHKHLLCQEVKNKCNVLMKT